MPKARRDNTTGASRWLKIAGIAAVVVGLLVVIVMVIGGSGGHGPSRHMPPGDGDGHTPPSGGHAPPPGGHR